MNNTRYLFRGSKRRDNPQSIWYIRFMNDTQLLDILNRTVSLHLQPDQRDGFMNRVEWAGVLIRWMKEAKLFGSLRATKDDIGREIWSVTHSFPPGKSPARDGGSYSQSMNDYSMVRALVKAIVASEGYHIPTFPQAEKMSGKDIMDLMTQYHLRAENTTQPLSKTPEFEQLVDCGDQAIPYIIHRMINTANEAHWFHILTAITHQVPLKPEFINEMWCVYDVPAVRRAWIKWSQRNQIDLPNEEIKWE